MPYTVKGRCVYKKEDNSKVGCTNGSVNKYLAALHANANESTNILKGGKSDNLTLQDIADKFNISINNLKSELNKGKKVELEHTNDHKKALEIAMDHLSEFPDYYSRLEKMEKDASKKWELKEHIKKSLRKKLL